MTDTVDFGTDINRLWQPSPTGDFQLVSGTDNALQAVYNRLMTKLDELIQFGYTNYGNQSHEVPGSTDIETAKQEIILYTTRCLLQEPRVEGINSIHVTFDGINSINVEADFQLIGEPNTSNLVFNLSN